MVGRRFAKPRPRLLARPGSSCAKAPSVTTLAPMRSTDKSRSSCVLPQHSKEGPLPRAASIKTVWIGVVTLFPLLLAALREARLRRASSVVVVRWVSRGGTPVNSDPPEGTLCTCSILLTNDRVFESGTLLRENRVSRGPPPTMPGKTSKQWVSKKSKVKAKSGGGGGGGGAAGAQTTITTPAAWNGNIDRGTGPGPSAPPMQRQGSRVSAPGMSF